MPRLVNRAPKPRYNAGFYQYTMAVGIRGDWVTVYAQTNEAAFAATKVFYPEYRTIWTSIIKKEPYFNTDEGGSQEKVTL